MRRGRPLGRDRRVQRRVDDEAETRKKELRAGTFDSPQALVGLEYELYGADDDTDEPVRIPRDPLEFIGFESGSHNAGMHTTLQPLTEFGIASRETAVQARPPAANDRARLEGIRPVGDGR